jgi:hypothetical protein
MPAPGTGQPDFPAILQFNIKNVTVQEPGLPPTAIVRVGASFTITTDIEILGVLNVLLKGGVLEIAHHLEEVQTGTRLVIGVTTVPVPPPTPLFSNINFPKVSGPFPGGTLVIPPGFASGTYRVLTHVHHTDPLLAPVVAAFHDGLIIMVTP